jgi:hypothetical protein
MGPRNGPEEEEEEEELHSPEETDVNEVFVPIHPQSNALEMDPNIKWP